MGQKGHSREVIATEEASAQDLRSPGLQFLTSRTGIDPDTFREQPLDMVNNLGQY